MSLKLRQVMFQLSKVSFCSVLLSLRKSLSSRTNLQVLVLVLGLQSPWKCLRTACVFETVRVWKMAVWVTRWRSCRDTNGKHPQTMTLRNKVRNNAEFADLHVLFEKIFCTPATWAPIRRVCSTSGLFMRPHRARMGNKLLSELVMIKCNLKQ